MFERVCAVHGLCDQSKWGCSCAICLLSQKFIQPSVNVFNVKLEWWRNPNENGVDLYPFGNSTHLKW